MTSRRHIRTPWVVREGETSGAAVLDLYIFPIPVNTIVRIQAHVECKNANGDGAGFDLVARFSRGSDSASMVGSPSSLVSQVSMALIGVTSAILLSSNNAIVRVTGMALQELEWMADIRINQH